MIEFKGNFVLSVALHAATVAAFFVSSWMDLEVHIPHNFVAVSLFEERTDKEPEDPSPLRIRHRHGNASPVEPSSQENIHREDENSVGRTYNKKEDASDNKGPMRISVNREAGLSDIGAGSGIDIPPVYSGSKRKGESSETLSSKDPYSLIRDAISRAKTYPLLARKRKIEGTVVTGFSIDEKGRPQDLKIEKSSGYEILDSAAVRIVTKAAPFPKVNGQISVPITFKLTESAWPN